MGYYTSYTLEIRGIEVNSTNVIDALIAEMSSMGIIGYALDSSYWTDNHGTLVFDSTESVKWYDHDEDMLKLSKTFPEYTFKLSGDGEDNDDRWDTYYHNGDMEDCPWSPTPPKRIAW